MTDPQPADDPANPDRAASDSPGAWHPFAAHRRSAVDRAARLRERLTAPTPSTPTADDDKDEK